MYGLKHILSIYTSTYLSMFLSRSPRRGQGRGRFPYFALELRYSYPYPCPESSFTNFLLYPFLLRACSTNCLGHGHGYECHSPVLAASGFRSLTGGRPPCLRLCSQDASNHATLDLNLQRAKPGKWPRYFASSARSTTCVVLASF